MVRKLKLESLENDLAAVRDLLSRRTSEADPIGFAQYSFRLNHLESEIEKLRGTAENRASIALFFAGEPVMGSRGIKAEFAGKAVDYFQDLISKQFANEQLGSMGQRGPVPLRSTSDMLLTDVARGSIGLILEEADRNESLTDSELTVAVKKVTEDIAATAGDSSEGFEELLEQVDPRYFGSLSALFKHLDDSRASLRLVEGDQEFDLSPVAIHRGRERTDAAVLHDDDNVRMRGRLFLLPAHKKFELVVSGAAEILYGNVSREFAREHLEELMRRNDVVGREWEVRLKTRTITRPNREPQTKYTLLGLVRPMGRGS
jgi:hypothetical protein